MLPGSILNFPEFGLMSPLIQIERMRRQMDALSDFIYRDVPGRREVAAGVFPLLNLTENKDNYFVRSELPGIKAEDLDIQIADKTLTISGERKILDEGENARYHRRERQAGRFSRPICLPGDIDSGRIKATMQDGLLMVTIPKAETAKPKQITVNQ